MDKLPFTMDIGTICRICLANGASHHIFDTEDTKLAADINTFLRVKITDDDHYSKLLCENCMKVIEHCRYKRKRAADRQLVHHFMINQSKKDCDVKLKNQTKSKIVFKPTAKKDCDVKLRNELKSSIVSKPSPKEVYYEKLKNELKSRIVSESLAKENNDVELKDESKSRTVSELLAKENRDVELKNELKSRIVSKRSAKENCDGELNNELKSNIDYISSTNEDCNVEFKKEFKSIIVSKPLVKEERDVELDNRLKSNIDPKSSAKEDCNVEFKKEFKSIIVSKPLVKEDLDVELNGRLKSNIDPKYSAKEDCDVELKNEPKSSVVSEPLIKVSIQKNGFVSNEIKSEKKNEYLKCKYCDLILNTVNEFAKHLSKVHCIVVELRYNKLRFCPLCERNCNINDFLKHIHNCMNNMKVGNLLLNQFFCNVCNVYFNGLTDCQFRKHFLYCKSFQKFNFNGKLHLKCMNCTFESNNIDLCMSHASSTCLYLQFNLKYALNFNQTEETKYLNEIKHCIKPFIRFDDFDSKYTFFGQFDYDEDFCRYVKQWHCIPCQAVFNSIYELKAHYLTYSLCYTRTMTSLFKNNKPFIKKELIKKELKTEPIN